MGKEADFILLLGTRSTIQLNVETRRFSFDKHRLPVALTFAKEGMFRQRNGLGKILISEEHLQRTAKSS